MYGSWPKHQSIFLGVVVNNFRFIATDLLYRPPSNKSFNTIKQTFLEQQLSGYVEKSALEKYEQIQNAFCEVIPQAKSGAILSAFMKKRLTFSENKYVLSHDQCLDYIESFYFLYQNHDPVFHLNHQAKAAMLTLLEDAMTDSTLCEEGRYIRFESIIMEFRADQNWIDNLLQKQRYLIITALHEAYGAGVHTLGVMQQRAHDKNLGITPMHTLHDVYMSNSQKQSINTYFDQHYRAHFTEYENNVVNNLSEHVLFKIGELLKQNHINIEQWDTNGVLLPNGYQIKLLANFEKCSVDTLEKDTIYLYLQNMHFQDEQIYGITQHGVPFPIIAPLKKIEPSRSNHSLTSNTDFDPIKQRLKEGRKTLLDSFQEQLILSSLADRGGENYLAFNNIFLKLVANLLKLSTLKEIQESFWDEPEIGQWVLKSKPACLEQIQKHIRKILVEEQYVIPFSHFYADQVDYQPAQLRLETPITLELIETTAQQLRESMHSKRKFLITIQQETISKVLLIYPFILLKQMNNQLSWLSSLPFIYRTNSKFMDEVIQFFIFKIEKNEKETLSQMVQYLLNAIGEQIEYLDRLPENFQQHPIIAPLLSKHKHDLYQCKNETIKTLSTTPNIPLSQLIRLTQHLTPHEFSRIIQTRAETPQLNPLSYTDNAIIFSQFCHEFRAINESNQPAVICLLATDYWFLAFMRYQHYYTYFDSRLDIYMHLQQIRMSLHFYFNIVIDPVVPVLLAVINIWCFIEYYILPVQTNIQNAQTICINKLFDTEMNPHLADSINTCKNLSSYTHRDLLPFFLEDCLKILVHNSSQLNWTPPSDSCGRRTHRPGVYLILYLLVLWIFTMRYQQYFRNNPCFSQNNLSFWDESMRFIQRMLGTFINKQYTVQADDLLTRCEDNLFRLQGLDSPSAHQKAEQLTCQLDEIKEELGHNIDDYHLAMKLQAKYPSFFDIANQKRQELSFDPFPKLRTQTAASLLAPPFGRWFQSIEPQENNEEVENLMILDRV